MRHTHLSFTSNAYKMKSNYSAPTCNIISLHPSLILASSDPKLKCHDDVKIENEPQLSNRRGPFGNGGIWENMTK